MKKVFAILLVCFAVATASKAQDKAIGLRGGNVFAVTGQMAMGDANRIEANLAFYGGGLGLSGTYQFVKDLPQLGPDFKWFYGGGADLKLGGAFGLGIGALAGIEYNFQDIPLQLTLDLNPSINIIGFHPWWGYSGLSARYRF